MEFYLSPIIHSSLSIFSLVHGVPLVHSTHSVSLVHLEIETGVNNRLMWWIDWPVRARRLEIETRVNNMSQGTAIITTERNLGIVAARMSWRSRIVHFITFVSLSHAPVLS